MTTTVTPEAGTAAAVRGRTPHVARVIDHDTHTVVIDFAAPELFTDLIRTLRQSPLLHALLEEAVRSGDIATTSHALTRLQRAMATSTTWTLRPDDAAELAEQIDAACIEPDGCRISGCESFADNDLDRLCAAHLEGRA